MDFYPRPPRGGRPTSTTAKSMRWNFYPRPPRGGRPPPGCVLRVRDHISIHALREEGDHRTFDRFQVTPEFLSTPSARRATIAQ